MQSIILNDSRFKRSLPYVLAVIGILLYLAFPTTTFASWSPTSTSLNGSNQNWEISDASQTGLDITGDMTIGMWVKLDSSSEKILLSKWNHVSKTSYLLVATGSSVELYLNPSSSGYGYSSRYGLHGKSVGEWFHLGVVYHAASSSVEYFIDGESIGLGMGGPSLPSSIADSAAKFIIGGRENGDENFDGNLDDVRIWSRVLSDSEIEDLYSDPDDFNNGSNLAGYWKFDGNGDDSSSNNNDLTAINGAGFAHDTANTSDDNKSVQFMGNTSASISDSAQSGLDITGDMSASMWVNFATTSETILFSKWTHVSNTSYMLNLTGSNVELYLNSSPSGYGYSSASIAHGRSLGEWFQLGLVYKAANNAVEFFINGQSIGFGSGGSGLPGSISNSGAPFVIGGREGTAPEIFEGYLDDVQIWNRALSATEMDNVFDYPVLFENGSGLKGHWKFDDTLLDSSGTDNDLGSLKYSSNSAY